MATFRLLLAALTPYARRARPFFYLQTPTSDSGIGRTRGGRTIFAVPQRLRSADPAGRTRKYLPDHPRPSRLRPAQTRQEASTCPRDLDRANALPALPTAREQTPRTLAIAANAVAHSIVRKRRNSAIVGDADCKNSQAKGGSEQLAVCPLALGQVRSDL